jgi:glycosyltransferase involved in cell wall biosynthesis
MRVALIAGTLAQGGAEKQAAYMALALRRAGHDVRVFTLGGAEHYGSIIARGGVDVVDLGRSAPRALRLGRLMRALRRFGPHVVQATHFYTTLYAALGARASGALAIGALRNDGILDVHEAGSWGPLLLRLPHAFIANSHAAKRNAAQLGLPADRIHVVWNVIEPTERTARISSAESPTAVAVARLVPAKRIDRLLAAFALARPHAPTLRLVIVGDGPERKRLEAGAASLGLGVGEVEFRGRVADVAPELTCARMLVLPSRHEGFPNVVLEAMAAGLPVVTTPAGDAALVVQDGVTGFVVSHDDVAQLADRMGLLARDPALAARLGAAGAARVRAAFGPAELAPRLLAVYRSTGARRGPTTVPLPSVQ